MKNSIRRISQLIPKIPAVAAALLALSALSSQAIADGTETLGPPSIPIASGTDVIIAGTGLSLLQPDNIAINIPAGSTVKQVLLYWEGRDTIPTPDDTIIVNGIPVTGALIGGPVFWTPNGTTNFGYSFTYVGAVIGGIWGFVKLRAKVERHAALLEEDKILDFTKEFERLKVNAENSVKGLEDLKSRHSDETRRIWEAIQRGPHP